jgi:hypothetical protein
MSIIGKKEEKKSTQLAHHDISSAEFFFLFANF